jgi:hypothetical protein
MRSRHFHSEWSYSATASARHRTVGIALVAIAIGAAAGACVVVSLIAASGLNSSISAHDTLVSAAPVVKPPPASAAPGISVPASEGGVLEPEPASLRETQKTNAAIAAVAEPTHVEAGALMERGPKKKRATKPKKHRAGNRWRGDRIQQRAALLERLKPQ